jgi:uncharacterized membrane protein YkoI
MKRRLLLSGLITAFVALSPLVLMGGSAWAKNGEPSGSGSSNSGSRNSGSGGDNSGSGSGDDTGEDDNNGGTSGSGNDGSTNDETKNEDENDRAKAEKELRRELEEAVKRGEAASVTAVIKLALKAKPGKVIDVRLRQDKGQYVYSIRILDTRGRRIELFVNPKTRQIMRQR